MTKKPTRQPGTLDPLAAALKVSKRRVSQLLAEGMPSDPAAALKWREEKQSGDGSPEELRRQRIELVREQRRKLKLENEVRAGHLVSAASVQASATNVAATARNRLLKSANDLPPRLAGLGEVAILKILRAEYLEILTDLSNPQSYTKQA